MSYEQRQAQESLYRDANSLLYADNKPSEEAIDRVIHKLNIESVSRDLPSCFSDSLLLVKTNEINSQGSVLTRTKVILHTLMSATVSSTRRFVDSFGKSLGF